MTRLIMVVQRYELKQKTNLWVWNHKWSYHCRNKKSLWQEWWTNFSSETKDMTTPRKVQGSIVHYEFTIFKLMLRRHISKTSRRYGTRRPNLNEWFPTSLWKMLRWNLGLRLTGGGKPNCMDSLHRCRTSYEPVDDYQVINYCNATEN